MSFGTRIHGNIASILCNIPAVIITHDPRVTEISEFYKLPTTQIPKEKVDLYDLYQKIDYSEFNKILPERCDNWQAFFDENGIPVNLGYNEAFEQKCKSFDFKEIYKKYI